MMAIISHGIACSECMGESIGVRCGPMEGMSPYPLDWQCWVLLHTNKYKVLALMNEAVSCMHKLQYPDWTA